MREIYSLAFWELSQLFNRLEFWRLRINDYLEAVEDRHLKVQEDQVVLWSPRGSELQDLVDRSLAIKGRVQVQLGFELSQNLFHHKEVISRIVYYEDPDSLREASPFYQGLRGAIPLQSVRWCQIFHDHLRKGWLWR